ncbi:MAG: hypothetical protein KDK39_12390 [Leptospiraceae bacterium]|nr:hypothetical protein [Leptospiraceae bacterium]
MNIKSSFTNRLWILIYSILVIGSIFSLPEIALAGIHPQTASNTPARIIPTQTRLESSEFKACRDGCQDRFDLCMMRCPHHGYRALACRNVCVEDYRACMRYHCQNL